jgi:formate C-acetyltransferase
MFHHLVVLGNVFSAEELKKAQKDPEKYKNLQIRLCGWNVRFVNLNKQEQDEFILQAAQENGL